MSPLNEESPLLTEQALLTVNLEGLAYLNREASRILPIDLSQLRLAAPTAIGGRWWLLPGLAGVAVRPRSDRVGYLRFRAPELAAYAFAIQPAGTKLLHFELRPAAGYFQLYPVQRPS